jgi:rRNA maturation RNase YbeY
MRQENIDLINMIKKSVCIEFNYSKAKFKKLVKFNVDKEYLSRYIKKLCGKKVVYMSYNFVSYKEQIKMNTEFKYHNYNTDILTFELSNTDCELTGDVYISLKQVEKNAKRYRVDIKEELNRVLIHGFLHITGYKDETMKEKRDMRREEDLYLRYIYKKCSTWNNSIYHY